MNTTDLDELEEMARNRFNGGLSLTSEEALALISMARTPRATLHPEQIAGLATRCGVKGSAAALAEFAALVREAEPMAPEEMRPALVAAPVEEAAPEAPMCGACGKVWDGEQCAQKDNGWPHPVCYPVNATSPKFSEDGSLSIADAVAGVLDLFPSADKQALQCLAELMGKPTPVAAPEAPASEQQAQADRVVEWSASYAATTASASVDALLEAHAAAAIAAHEHGDTAGYYDDLRAAEKAIRAALTQRPTNPTE